VVDRKTRFPPPLYSPVRNNPWPGRGTELGVTHGQEEEVKTIELALRGGEALLQCLTARVLFAAVLDKPSVLGGQLRLLLERLLNELEGTAGLALIDRCVTSRLLDRSVHWPSVVDISLDGSGRAALAAGMVAHPSRQG